MKKISTMQCGICRGRTACGMMLQAGGIVEIPLPPVVGNGMVVRTGIQKK